MTFVAGVRHNGMVAPFVVDGPMNRASFLVYLESQSDRAGVHQIEGTSAQGRRANRSRSLSANWKVDSHLHRGQNGQTPSRMRAMLQHERNLL